MSNALQLSIIIPTHFRAGSLRAGAYEGDSHDRSRDERQESLLDRCLRSICAQDLEPSFFEVLVVTNLPEPAAKEICRFFRESGLDVKFLVAGRIGVNFARNTGIASARGEVLYFLDDDCCLTRPEHLTDLLRYHKEHSQMGLIGGAYRYPKDASLLCRNYCLIINTWLKSHDPALLPGGNLSIKRVKLGADRFDESIVYGGSETPLQHRLLNRGVQSLLRLDLAVEHRFTGTATILLKKAWAQGEGKAKLSWKGHQQGSRLKRSFRRVLSESSLAEKASLLTFGVLYTSVAQIAWLKALCFKPDSSAG